MRGLSAFVAGLCLIALALASSHSEAPGTAAIPQADGTDLYLFRAYEQGRENFTVIIANFLPLQNPYGGPNYFSLSEQHVYDIYIDNTGDGVEDITFRFLYGHRYGGPVSNTTIEVDDYCSQTPELVTGELNTGIALNISGVIQPIALKYAGPITATDQSNLNWFESYQISYITGPRNSSVSQFVTQAGSTNTRFTKPFDYVGTKTFPDYNTYANQFIYNITIPGCGIPGRVFVGQRKESFQINLGPIFDLINFIPIPGFPGAILPSKANNNLADKNVLSFALELPIKCIVGNGNGVIGAWQATLQLYHDSQTGAHVVGKQVQRLGNPLVNELLIGINDKAKYNRGVPSNDNTFVLNYVQYPTFPEIISALFKGAVNAQLHTTFTTLAPTNLPRNDLVLTFLQGIPGINQLKQTTLAEYMRLNTSIPPTAPAKQNVLGVIGGDLAGFPNGRRPADDTVDIGLDVLMGKLCWLGITCTSADAVVGNVPFNDGVPMSVFDYDLSFPYLKLPIPGATNPKASPTPGFSPIFTPTPSLFCPSSSPTTFSWALPITAVLLFIPLLALIFSAR